MTTRIRRTRKTAASPDNSMERASSESPDSQAQPCRRHSARVWNKERAMSHRRSAAKIAPHTARHLWAWDKPSAAEREAETSSKSASDSARKSDRWLQAARQCQVRPCETRD